MHYPLLYEINTRCWLRELSARAGQRVDLSNVPEPEIKAWSSLGFTHIWLMGVWTSGPRARARALTDPVQRAVFSQTLPDWQEEDIAGSPYAVAEYKVPDMLGGDEGLEQFRRRLKEAGMRLVLDFVPNHVGLDNPAVWEHPELFVQAENSTPETFRQSAAGVGAVWLAHGKDPNFSAWSDTVQLDYRRAATRKAMMELLVDIAGKCDGVRCDMAMLLLNEVFTKTWATFPNGDAPPSEEFWQTAITAVKRVYPEFIFLAEVYWGLERRLQSLGFDYTYDKALYDRLLSREPVMVQHYIADHSNGGLRCGAHFLENHDESRIAGLMAPSEQQAAALVVLGLPGLRFLHEGQLAGARVRIPVQLIRRPQESPNPEVQKFYTNLLSNLNDSAVGQGTFEILQSRPAWPGNPTAQNFILVQWQKREPEFDLVVVNLAPHRSQCYAPLRLPDSAAENWQLKDRLGSEQYIRYSGDLQAHGLYLDLPPHGAQLFHFQPASKPQ